MCFGSGFASELIDVMDADKSHRMACWGNMVGSHSRFVGVSNVLTSTHLTRTIPGRSISIGDGSQPLYQMRALCGPERLSDQDACRQPGQMLPLQKLRVRHMLNVLSLHRPITVNPTINLNLTPTATGTLVHCFRIQEHCTSSHIVVGGDTDV